MDNENNKVEESASHYQLSTLNSLLVKEGYKQTEVGVIPEDWELAQISNITTEVGDGIHSTPNYSNSGRYYFVNGNNFISGKVVINEETKQVDESEYIKHKKNLNQRTIFISINGTIGNIAYYNDEKIILGKSAAYLNINASISREYAFYSFQADYVKNHFADELTGTTIKNLGLGVIRATPIIIPSDQKEQKAIAKALSDVDALINAQEKLIAKKQAIKTATMQQLLTGKKRLSQIDNGELINDNENNPDDPSPHIQTTNPPYKFKKTELGEIPEDWEVVTLGDVADFLKGKGLSKKQIVVGGKNKCIHYGELFTYYKEVIDQVASSTNLNENVVKSLNNDVLMPTSDVTPNGLATASCIVEKDVILGGDILVIRASREVLDGIFFSYVVRMNKPQIMSLVSGSTVYHLYGRDMSKFTFIFPKLASEQKAIAKVLSDMDSEIEALQTKLLKTKSIKQGMMQELLTGKTRLIDNG